MIGWLILALLVGLFVGLQWRRERCADLEAQLAGERALRRAGLPRDIDAEVSAEFEAAELERMWER